MAASVFECKVCNEEYDSDERKPINLVCGHTFCLSCVNNLEPQDDKVCPSCREAVELPVDQLTIVYDLIPSKNMPVAGSASVIAANKCSDHRYNLDLLCVDCEDLVCWKCARGNHQSHKVESMMDIADRDLAIDAKKDFRARKKVKLELLSAPLSVCSEVVQLSKEFVEWRADIEDLHELLSKKQTSMKKYLENWDALILNSSSIKDVFRLTETVGQLNSIGLPQNEDLPLIRATLDQLRKKLGELEKLLLKKSPTKLSSAPPLPKVELLCDATEWLINGEAAVRNAFYSVRAKLKPSSVTVLLLPSTNFIPQLPELLQLLVDVVANIKFKVILLDFFWKPSATRDRRLTSVIEKHWSRIVEFYGLPEDVPAINSCIKCPILKIGIVFTSLGDIDQYCDASSGHSLYYGSKVLPTSICCIKGLPEEAGERIKQRNLRPNNWHFPDLQDCDLKWMRAILKPNVQPSCLTLYLPHCQLTEGGFRDLLYGYPGYPVTIYCAPVSLSAEAKSRVAALAEEEQVKLKWRIVIRKQVCE